MFPRHLLCCVADEDEFHRYKDQLAWFAERYSASITLLNSQPYAESRAFVRAALRVR